MIKYLLLYFLVFFKILICAFTVIILLPFVFLFIDSQRVSSYMPFWIHFIKYSQSLVCRNKCKTETVMSAYVCRLCCCCIVMFYYNILPRIFTSTRLLTDIVITISLCLSVCLSVCLCACLCDRLFLFVLVGRQLQYNLMMRLSAWIQCYACVSTRYVMLRHTDS